MKIIMHIDGYLKKQILEITNISISKKSHFGNKKRRGEYGTADRYGDKQLLHGRGNRGDSAMLISSGVQDCKRIERRNGEKGV